MHPKITDVSMKEPYVLIITFDNNEKRLYDFNNKLEMDRFKQLKNYGLFKKFKIDNGGYGIVFNDDVEVSEYEIYKDGIRF